MANRKLKLAQQYHTAPQVAKELGLSRFQLTLRIKEGILPAPTLVDTTGVRYFDGNWLRIAKIIITGTNRAN